MFNITSLLDNYGYIVLIVALFLELIAFPLPGELLMSYCGFLVYEGKLNFYLCILFSVIGTISGITFSYFIGKSLGTKFFEKYGKYIHFGPEQIKKTATWFDRYGDRLIIFAFFIFGVRHITGYFSGITKKNYKRFATNAYLGALIWTSTFIYLGKIFGGNWGMIHTKASKYLLIIALSIITILVATYIIKTYINEIIQFMNTTIIKIFALYHSFRKTKLIITGIIVATISLLVLVFGIIQDFLANEFTQFDSIVTYIVKSTFNTHWTIIMKVLYNIISLPILILVIGCLFIWIVKNGKAKLLETRMIIVTLIGGWIFQEFLTRFFKLIKIQDSPANDIYTFPSEQTFMAIILLGLILNYLIRYNKNLILIHFAFSTVIFLLLGIGISCIYLNIQYPIDVIAGYTIGGVWLGVNIILFEINHLIIHMKDIHKI